MDTNLVKPENEKFRTFYASEINFCDGNACAAGLLDFFDRFHSVKLEQRKSNRKHNDIAEQHGDSRSQNERLFQSHTQEELADYLMGIFSVSTIRIALKLLLDKKIISIHKNPNPKYQFDKTNYYLFHPEIFNKWVRANDYSVADSRTTKLDHRSRNFTPSKLHNPDHRSGKFTPAIDNLDLNKENNLNLTQADANEISEQTTGLVEGCFFENEKIIEKDKHAKQFISSSEVIFGTIGDTLTETQHSELQQRFYVLQRAQKNKLSVPSHVLLEEITFCLLDKTALTNCHHDFHRKLCCIEELIIKGKWRTPYGLLKACQTRHPPRKTSPSHEELQSVLQEVRELQQAIAGDEALANLLPETPVNVETRTLIEAKNQQRRILLKMLLSKKQHSLDTLAAEENAVRPNCQNTIDHLMMTKPNQEHREAL